MNDKLILPMRKRLSHTPPVSVSQYTVHSFYFITICVDRNSYGFLNLINDGPLIKNGVAIAILDAIEHRRNIGKWFPKVSVVMPDHIHIITSFAENVIMEKSIREFKRYISNRFNVVWQRGFFDHRLRDEKEIAEKFHYIEMNPISKGLCSTVEEWPNIRVWDIN